MNSSVYERISYADSLYNIKKDGLFLKFISNQDEEICFEAIKNNPRALKYAQYQNEEMCLLAVSNCGDLLKYVHERTELI